MMTADETPSSKLFSAVGENNYKGLSENREEWFAKSSRNMTDDFECIIMKVCVSKHREENIVKESRNVLNIMWSIMNVCVYVTLWL